MSAFATRVEARHGRSLSPDEIFELARAREASLSRLLMLYIVTGLVFMLLPGTFLGVWNLISISSREAAESVSPAWLQAHGHAQVFGWVATFILGIGFYSIPKLRRMEPFGLWVAWLTWTLWTVGVALRWATNIYQWQWRWLLPLSAGLELSAFLLFFYSVSGHKPRDGRNGKLELWARIVVAATVGLLLTLVVNLGGSIYAAARAASPAFPSNLDQRFLALAAWGFLIPFAWGFNAKWFPIFLGLKPAWNRWLAFAVIVNCTGVLAALVGQARAAALLTFAAATLVPFALRLFARPQQPSKLLGVHRTFPFFVRLAYAWLILAAGLGIWAALAPHPLGIGGGGRHALTVGFISMMIFAVGQRILPAFSGMRLLFSARMMFLSMTLLATGCFLRVSAEILAYQNYAAWAWPVLPVSALTELAAVTVFAINIVLSFARRPAPQLVFTQPSTHA